MHDMDDCAMNKMEKGWAIATQCSKERLRRIYEWTDAELDTAVKEGLVMLETICVFVHGCIKSGQFKYAKVPIRPVNGGKKTVIADFGHVSFRLPVEFWKILHAEYGIVVYPSALTECIATAGLGTSQTFAEVYSDHIVMLGKRNSSHPPPCPFEYLKEPLPVYEK